MDDERVQEEKRHQERVAELKALLEEENQLHAAKMKLLEAKRAEAAAAAVQAAAPRSAAAPAKLVKKSVGPKKVSFKAPKALSAAVQAPAASPAKAGAGPSPLSAAAAVSPKKSAPGLGSPAKAKASPKAPAKGPASAAAVKKSVTTQEKSVLPPNKAAFKGGAAKLAKTEAKTPVVKGMVKAPAKVALEGQKAALEEQKPSAPKAVSKGLAAARFAAAIQTEKPPEKKVAAIPAGPRKVSVKLSSRHSLQIDARALLPGTRPPKPQVAAEATAALTEDGSLEISNSAPNLQDEALRGSKQRIAIKPKRAARAKSMMVKPVHDDWDEEGGEDEAAEEKTETIPEAEEAAAEPLPAQDEVAEAERLADTFPESPIVKIESAKPVVVKQTPLKIAAKPLAPSTAKNLENLWDDAPVAKTSDTSSGAFADIFADTKPSKPAPVEIIPAKEEDIFGEGANFLTSTKSTTDFFNF